LYPNASRDEDRIEFFTMGIKVYFDTDGSLFIEPQSGVGYRDEQGNPLLSDEGYDPKNCFSFSFDESSASISIKDEEALDRLVHSEAEAFELVINLSDALGVSLREISFNEKREPPPIRIFAPDHLKESLINDIRKVAESRISIFKVGVNWPIVFFPENKKESIALSKPGSTKKNSEGA